MDNLSTPAGRHVAGTFYRNPFGKQTQPVYEPSEDEIKEAARRCREEGFVSVYGVPFKPWTEATYIERQAYKPAPIEAGEFWTVDLEHAA